MKLLVSKCLDVGLDMMGAPQSHIRDISWMSNFHSGTLNSQALHIVDVCVQGLDLRCDVTALDLVSWESA